MEEDFNSKVCVLGITRLALEQLCGASSDKIPPSWFQWNFKSSAGEIARVTLFENAQLPELEVWYETTHSASFAPLLLLGWGNEYLRSRCEKLQVAVVGPKTIDEEDHREFLAIFSEPDHYVGGDCAAILRGGGRRLLDARVTEPGFWAAYGQGLHAWYKNHPDKSSVPRSYVEFAEWQSELVLGYDDFDFSGDNRFEGKLFFPMKKFPCCGLVQEANGEFSPHGLLASDWSFDRSGKLRQALSSIDQTVN
jgi:hypothetical protein